ncbi:IS4 family transposase [Kitasatospora sp. NPDC085895]|uniref:IS4 family transposase n=1 Tax=Kitasatospora sp. NPDC085895 TaxID=3155057 RepID=UPI00344B4FE5
MRVHFALSSGLTTITRSVTVAAGRFAPGHLGELTAVVPFELVDAVLAETRTVQRRLRDLPSRVGMYFPLAMCLFPEVGYRLVWDKLTAGLAGMPVASPSAKALRDLRRRLGAVPVRSLFEVLSGPLARPTTSGVRFGAYRTVSFDGCSSLRVPDAPRNRAWLGRTPHHGYPTLELMTLVETGTRSLIGAVFGPTDVGETAYACQLLDLLRPDMLVLWDKGFDANAFLAQVTATGAKVPGRLRSNRRTPVLARLHDGSYLSVIGTVAVRVIDAEITVTCADGTAFTGSYRLVTTLTDARRHPATALISLYHERWEHESAYYALRHTILAGRNLRSGDRVGLEQEMWALLTLYQALRTVMVEAAESVPSTDPDRCCFTVAIQTARDQVVQAAGILPADPYPLGLIGRRVLARLLAPRRHRTSTRKVKSPMSRYSERRNDGRPDRSRTITDLAVTVLEPDPEQLPLPAASRDDRYTVPAQRRRHRILSLLEDDPTRLWRPAEIAAHFGDVTCTPCIGSSPDGPTAASSTRSGLASTQRQLGHQRPCNQRKSVNFPALGEGPYVSRGWTSPASPGYAESPCTGQGLSNELTQILVVITEHMRAECLRDGLRGLLGLVTEVPLDVDPSSPPCEHRGLAGDVEGPFQAQVGRLPWSAFLKQWTVSRQLLPLRDVDRMLRALGPVLRASDVKVVAHSQLPRSACRGAEQQHDTIVMCVVFRTLHAAKLG